MFSSALNKRGYIKTTLLLFVFILLTVLSFKGNTLYQQSLSNNNLAGCIDNILSPIIQKFPELSSKSMQDDQKTTQDKTEVTSNEIDYKQIRANIPINPEKSFYSLDKHMAEYKTIDLGGKKVKIYYPKKAGEVTISKKVQSPKGKETKEINFNDWGLLFLVHIDGKNNPVVTENNFWLTDIYQKTSQSTFPQEAFSCSTTPLPPGPVSLVFPTSDKPSIDKKELQLERFEFEQPSFTKGIGWSPHCKPAIYLYPKEKIKVSVKVNTTGVLTYTDPLYPKEGWEVTAYPDGTIYDSRSTINDTPYPYLYYESKVPDELINKPKDGIVVRFEELTNLYNYLLPKLGLNSTQTQDFISYWKKALPYSPYYFVGIMSKEDINAIEPLEIYPQPDFINRVRIYFQALEKKDASTKLPSLPSTTHYPPSTFKVIEWGGMVKIDLLHPFTCSQ